MDPNFTPICRLLSVFLFIFLFNIGFSQSKENLDFKYKVETVQSNGVTQYEITVTVTKGDGPYYFELCDKPVALGGKVIQSTELVSDRKYVFSNLTNSEYYIYVYLSNRDFGRGKKILIK